MGIAMGTGTGIPGGGGMSGEWVGRRPLRWSRWLLFLCLFVPPSLLLAFAFSFLVFVHPPKPQTLSLSPLFIPLESFLELSELLLLRSSSALLWSFMLQVSNRIDSPVSLSLNPSPIRAS
jgi:hypothetical protein